MADPAEAFIGRALDLLDRTHRTVRDSLQLATNAIAHTSRLLGAIERDGRVVVLDAIAFWRSVEAAAREAEATARATPRVARILKEIARIAAVYRMYHIKRAFLSDPDAELEALHAKEAARLRVTLTEMGGGVLKVGQFLSCRADLLPAAWIAELRILQDQVPAAPEADVLALLQDELARIHPIDQIGADGLGGWFTTFEATPIAAASIAQVHRATLTPAFAEALGCQPVEVAIKVQRPGIDKVIAQDRRALSIVADLLAPFFKEVALAPVLAEVSRSLEEELDFASEAATAACFAAALGDDHVPRIYASTSRVIAMQFIEGARLVPFLDTAPIAERDAMLVALARVTAEAILVHGLVHADPHPGNFLVARTEAGPQLVLLDFGAAVRLSEVERQAVVALLPALFGKNTARVRELLDVLGFSGPDPEGPTAFAMAIASTLVPTNLADIDPRVELERGLALARQYPGMVVPGSFVQIGRSLAGLGGLFMTYRPALDLGSILFQVLARATAPRP